MVIIYEELHSELPECNIYKFIRLNFDTGEYDICYANFENANEYILTWRKLGYTFIHR